MPGRSVVSVLVLLHGLLCLQLVALPEIEMEDGGVMEEGSCMHFSVTPPPAPPEDAEERRDYFRAMAAKDLFRHQQLIAMMGSDRNSSASGSRRRQAKESVEVPDLLSAASMFELPMRSALNIAHVGMYLVSVRFGTPALPYSLVLDTGNDLTWINCRLRRRKGKHYGRQSSKTMSVGAGAHDVVAALAKKEAAKNWYRPAKSSSWRRIRCSEQQCAHLPYNTCMSPSKLESCSYYQKTQDGTVTIGIYGNEKATVTVSDGRMAKLPGLVLGCSVLEAGGSVDAHDGVLSLGNGDMSFAVHAAIRFGGRFSFCLLSVNSSSDASSYLTFGPNPAVMGPGTMETEVIYNVDVKPAYGPRVTGVLVGGERLDIPDDIWDIAKGLGNGAILDTSTSVTSLVPQAYDPLVAALNRHLAHLPRAEEIAGFDYCYHWNFTGDSVDPAKNVTIPRLTVEMAGGARLEPEAKSVVMPEVLPGVACLAFRRLPWGKGPCLIGNVLMQEYIWEVDHNDGKLRFRKDKCNTDHLHTSNGGEATASGKQANGGGGDAPSSSSTVVHRVN